MGRNNMNMNHRFQRGMSIWSFSLIALVGGFFVLVGVKMVPVYLTDMKIKSALTSLARDPVAQNAPKYEIKEMIRKRLEIDMAERAVNLEQDLAFERDGRARVIRIAYESVTPLFSNISILVQFDHKEKVGDFAGD
ncbi:MAG: DUF4845 domain-containing protein [Gammaproteobacteria bacterium]|nr:DUF4845 domain-containing protein [Gammaproteobacteria bacterium]